MRDDAHNDGYEVHSLADLDQADASRGRLVWDGPRSLWNMGMLATALIAGPLTFTWGGLAAFLVLSAVTLSAGHSVGVHRRMIHRSFECPKWVERICVYLGTLVGIGGPLWTMRLHDTRDWGQRQADCHWSLRHGEAMWKEGFTYLNFRLILDRPPRFRPPPDIAGDRLYQFLDRTWMAQQIPIALALFALGGWSWVVWGVAVRVAACTTMHWYISFLAHTDGPEDWRVDNAAIQGRNVPAMAIPTMGEAWHGNHHAFPRSARHGLYPGQIDIGWRIIQVMERFGLAWNVQTPATLPPRDEITPMTERAKHTERA